MAAPLLTKQGDLDSNVHSVLSDAKQSLPGIEQAQQELVNLSDYESTDYNTTNMKSNASKEYYAVAIQGNGFGWRVLNFLMGIYNWLCAIVYVITGISLISTSLILGIIFICVGIVICPWIKKKHNLSCKKKFVNKVVRYFGTLVVLTCAAMFLM